MDWRIKWNRFIFYLITTDPNSRTTAPTDLKSAGIPGKICAKKDVHDTLPKSRCPAVKNKYQMAYFNETEYKKFSVDNLCEQYSYKPSHSHAVLQLYQVDS